jgi:hypothetical protein
MMEVRGDKVVIYVDHNMPDGYIGKGLQDDPFPCWRDAFQYLRKAAAITDDWILVVKRKGETSWREEP